MPDRVEFGQALVGLLGLLGAFQLGDVRPVTGFFNLVTVWNFGVSFGMFNRGSDEAAWVLALVAAAITAALSDRLARFKQPNGPFSPSTLGSRASSETSTSTIEISPVTEARSESLPSIFGAVRPFMPFSSTKPRIFPPCASDFAQTTKTSAIGALVIHIFAPLRRYPVAVFSARVFIPAGSEPASGSVRPKQPIHSPEISLGRYLRFCASEP